MCATASGGGFRGPLGRLLFRTTGLYQSVLRGANPTDDPIVVNKVRDS